MPKTKKRGASTAKKKKRKTSPKTKKTNPAPRKPRKRTYAPRRNYSSGKNLDKVLVENFVSFQKIMVNLYTKFEYLSDKISKLLELFEISAKTLAEKDIKYTRNEEAIEIIEKMNLLLDQNKTIARGLTLMHEMVINSEQTPQKTQQIQRSIPPLNQQKVIPQQPQINPPQQVRPQQTPPQQAPMQSQMPMNIKNFGEYERSIPTGKSESASSMTEGSSFEQLPEKKNG